MRVIDCTASMDIATEVTTLRAEAQAARDTARTSQERLKELRKQVETTRIQCTITDKVLCDTIDTSGLEITFKVDKVLEDEQEKLMIFSLYCKGFLVVNITNKLSIGTHTVYAYDW